MKSSVLKHIKNLTITLVILFITFGICIALHYILNVWEHVTTLFVFAVFIISYFTDGYIYGISSALISVIAINYAFTYPYFNVDFSATVSVVSAIVMLVIAFLTSTFTTRFKQWQFLKSETEKEHMRANLLRAVSHDLRTPLTTIYGASSSIIDNYEKFNDTQKMQMLTGIKEDSEWLISIVENLLSITRIDNGNVKLVKTPTVLEELIDAVILKFKKRYPTQNIELDIPDEIVIISIDAILIEQVIINILENTIHHAKGFTKIILRVFVIDNKAIFEISDNGCGIAKEKLPNIFSGVPTMSEKMADSQKRNAGIGLSVCATIIKAHDGSISAENAKNGGAIFRFSLATEENTQYE